MSDLAALLLAVHDDPFHPTGRLILADYLEESGCQCEADSHRHLANLLQTNGFRFPLPDVTPLALANVLKQWESAYRQKPDVVLALRVQTDSVWTDDNYSSWFKLDLLSMHESNLYPAERCVNCTVRRGEAFVRWLGIRTASPAEASLTIYVHPEDYRCMIQEENRE